MKLILFVSLLSLQPLPANAGQIKIENRIDNSTWTASSNVTVTNGQKVQLRVKKIDNAEIKWFQIIPDTTTRYNNAEWPWMPNAYKWKGFDKIKYTRKELKNVANKWQISISNENRQSEETTIDRSGPVAYLTRKIFSSSDYSKSQFYNHDYGSFWYQAVVTKGVKTFKTPGTKDKDNRGLSPNVFRLSIKDGDDLMGNLTSFFNVPAIFGSTPYQVKNYIGVDCADVLMAAYCITNGKPIKKDYNVASLTRTLPVIKKAQITNGNPDKKIYWGKDIQRGNFIAVRYNGGRQYQHIGALYKDSNANNILDAEDMILHAGPDPLHYTRLDAGAFDGEVLILNANTN
ncbi:MAG: hypothetical protein ABFS18_11695 [Thermodesulfobacteriota bacterium]